MSLTPEQKTAVSAWVAAGDNLSAVQKKLIEQFKVSLTYRDVRFLVDDLNLELTDPAARGKLYEQAQVIFKEQAPWFTIAHAVQLKPVRKEVIDFKLSPFGRHNFYGVDIKE